MIEGTVTTTDAVLRLLRPHSREPIVEHRPPATLNLPTSETGTLILTNAAVLSRDEQQRLWAWMGDAGARAQVVTIASCALFPLVEAGVFDAALYYRLNVLLLRVSFPFQSGLLCDDLEGAPRHNSPIASSTSPFV